MNRQPLAIVGSGMLTGVGLNAPATCAAIRCGLDNIQETRFVDNSGEWITGSSVPLEKPWRGLAKLKHMVVPVISEALESLAPEDWSDTPVLLSVAEQNRVGRFAAGMDDQLMEEIQAAMDVRFHSSSKVISNGCVAGAEALLKAQEIIFQGVATRCLVVGVDTFLVSATLAAYESAERLLTNENSNGFIPGEAAAAILVARPDNSNGSQLVLSGLGFGKEKASISSEEPLKADGLIAAITDALSMAHLGMGDLDYRISDANGEQYHFKEGHLAVSRLLSQNKEEFDLWHPAECIGEVGAATVPVALCVADSAAKKNYAPGNNLLCHFGNDAGERTALVLTCNRKGDG